MTFQTGGQPGGPVGAPVDLGWQRQQVLDEMGRRQGAVSAAEADIGRAVVGELRAANTPPWSPQVAAEIERIAAAEVAIGRHQSELQAIDAEAAAAAAGVDPASRCPACRSGVTAGQRYCPACGEKLVLPTPAGLRQGMQPLAAPACQRCGRPIEQGISFCVGCGWRVALPRTRWYRSRWFRVLLAGITLYVFCQALLSSSHLPAFIVGELVIGAGLVPVAFVTWFYERGTRDQTPLAVLVTTFVAGAVLGAGAVATLGSPFDLQGNAKFLPVGFIEEGCKIAIVLAWLRRRDLRDPDKGLVLGAATGMGFAAFETMQYGFVAFFSAAQVPGANPTAAMVANLNARAVLAPLGHGTWTGILAAVIWYERSAGRSPFGKRVWVAYTGVSLLHALYDIAASSSVAPVPIPFAGGAQVSVFVVLLGLLGFGAIVGIVRLARKGRDPVSAFFEAAARMAREAGAAGSAPPPGPPPGWAPASWGSPGHPPPGYAPSGYPPPGYPPPGHPPPGHPPPVAGPPAGPPGGPR